LLIGYITPHQDFRTCSFFKAGGSKRTGNLTDEFFPSHGRNSLFIYGVRNSDCFAFVVWLVLDLSGMAMAAMM
jgi:hypothetical protein